jgi:HPt (histidine-containing phosphotransfer) domain-containing protein
MNEIKSRMAELASKFLDRTATDITAMHEGLGKLASGDAAGLGEIRHLAHRMVGTGATLGFESLSECAYRIEQLTESCEPGTLPDVAVREQLNGALKVLGAEYQKQRAR